MRPDAWLAGCVTSHRAIEAALAGLDDARARSASGLPGWTVGHLVTHIARNADAHTWVVEQAGLGEVAAMYPLGPGSREAAIEAGSGRPAADLLGDLRAAQVRLEAAWSGTSEEVWRSGLGRRHARPATVAELVLLRWREVEVHLRDLGPGLAPPGGGWDDLPAAYATADLAELAETLPGRLPEGVTVVLAPAGEPSRAYGDGARRVVVEGSAGRLVGWLTDRVTDDAWPALRPWGS